MTKGVEAGWVAPEEGSHGHFPEGGIEAVLESWAWMVWKMAVPFT